MIHIIGIGIDGRKGLGEKQLRLIDRAGLLVGGQRHLDEFGDVSARVEPIRGGLGRVASVMEEFIREKRSRGKRADVVVLATGDPLLFGIAGFMLNRFGKRAVEIIPNVSIVQEAFARIKQSWAGVTVLSAHGRPFEPETLFRDVSGSEKAVVYTDPVNTPQKVASALLSKGLTGYTVYVCESIGTDDERVVRGTLATVSRKHSFAPLNTMVLIRTEKKAAEGGPSGEGPSGAEAGAGAEAGGGKASHAPGIPDKLFSCSTGMLTKEEVRVVALSKLRLKSSDVVWDVGAGSGSVSVEASRIASGGEVYAFEKNPKRLKDIEENARRFDCPNVKAVRGDAPGCLKSRRLRAPDAVFVGGGGKAIEAILRQAAGRLKAGGRVVVNAVTIETAEKALGFFKEGGWESELVQVSVARSRDVGGNTMLSANNPVFIITGMKPEGQKGGERPGRRGGGGSRRRSGGGPGRKEEGGPERKSGEESSGKDGDGPERKDGGGPERKGGGRPRRRGGRGRRKENG